jgi:hypothetical protein
MPIGSESSQTEPFLPAVFLVTGISAPDETVTEILRRARTQALVN